MSLYISNINILICIYINIYTYCPRLLEIKIFITYCLRESSLDYNIKIGHLNTREKEAGTIHFVGIKNAISPRKSARGAIGLKRKRFMQHQKEKHTQNKSDEIEYYLYYNLQMHTYAT